MREQTCTTMATAPAPPDPSARFFAFSIIADQSTSTLVLIAGDSKF